MSSAFVGVTRWLVKGRSGAAAATQTTLMQCLVLLVNLATGVLTARALEPAGRGELAAIRLVPVMLSTLGGIGIPSALIYYVKRKPEHKREILASALVISSLAGLVAIVVGIFIMPATLHRYSPAVILIAEYSLVTVPLNLYYFVAAAVFESDNDFWYSNSTRFLLPFVTFGILAVALAFHRVTLLTAAIAYALPSLPITVKMLYDVVKRHRPKLVKSSEPYRDLFGYGLRLYGIDVLRAIAQQIDQILVVGFLSPERMGLYVVALSAGQLITVVHGSISRVLFPRISSRSLDEVKERVGRAARLSSLITLVLALILIAFGPMLLGVFYGSRYIDGAAVLRILTVETFVSSVIAILMSTFAAIGKPGMVTVFQAIGLAITVPLLVVMVPRYGLVGAGISLLISSSIRLVFVLASYRVVLHTSPPRLILNRDDVVDLFQQFQALRRG